MEIDLPNKPIHSVKDFFIHIFTITVGILIALALEQAIVAYHHHELASEARANIISELRDNKGNLDGLISGMKKIQQEHEHVIDVIDQLMKNRNLNNSSMALNFVGTELSTTSWTTAQTVGALAYMNYQDVKNFAEAYNVQQEFHRIQNETFDANNTAAGMMVSAHRGFDKMTDQELLEEKHKVQQSIAEYTIYEQVARELSKEYADVLSKYSSKK